jgi:hypothetical protein
MSIRNPLIASGEPLPDVVVQAMLLLAGHYPLLAVRPLGVTEALDLGLRYLRQPLRGQDALYVVLLQDVAEDVRVARALVAWLQDNIL